jgi:hypothetical protein
MTCDRPVGCALFHEIDKGLPDQWFEGEYRTGRILGVAHKNGTFGDADFDAFVVQVSASRALAPVD